MNSNLALYFKTLQLPSSNFCAIWCDQFLYISLNANKTKIIREPVYQIGRNMNSNLAIFIISKFELFYSTNSIFLFVPTFFGLFKTKIEWLEI